MIVTVFLAMVVSSPTLSANDGGTRTIIERLNTTLLDVMQSADELGYAGRYEKFDPSLRGSFDFAFMAKIATGRFWNGLDAEQREHLVERFAEMSIATFASRFDGFSGERFEIVGEKPGPRDTIVVDDRIIRPDDPPVGLNFVLKQTASAEGTDSWRIIDVMLDGKFSELARQRAEFSAVLEKGGYDELMTALDDQIKRLRAEG
ncbi:MAG: ABC transporter substrate-binding protein [Geminicoccaceae bacterium]